jgi:hypothetical protein
VACQLSPQSLCALTWRSETARLVFTRTTNALTVGATDEWLLNVPDVTVTPTLILDFGNPTLTSGEGMLAVEKIMAARTDARTPDEGWKSQVDKTYGADAKKHVNPTAVTRKISICHPSVSGGRKVKRTSSATPWPFHSWRARSCLPSRCCVL